MSTPLSILPAALVDVPHMAKVSAQAFEVDRHTVMKTYGAVKYDMEKGGLESYPKEINSKKVAFLKAVDPVTGEIMGWCAWGFRGLAEDEIPIIEGAVKDDEVGDGIWRDKGNKLAKKPAEPAEATSEAPAVVDDGVRRLNKMTDDDITDWMMKMMPDGTRCMFVVGLTVDPKFQRRGVGKALLKWGTETADRLAIWIWVHSSQGAKTTYESAGFEPVGKLEIDLDEWAPIPPPPEHDHDGSGKWGIYTLTYLTYGKGRWVPS